jgi:flagellar hook assembly protein FlgD
MDVTATYAPPNPNAVERITDDQSDSLMSIDDIGDFLTLFVAQLENQDPLSPADGADFLNQTAQITSVEQLMKLNTNNEATQASLDNLARNLASSYLGKEVVAMAEDEDGTMYEAMGLVTDVYYKESGDPVVGLDSGAMVQLKDIVMVSSDLTRLEERRTNSQTDETTTSGTTGG